MASDLTCYKCGAPIAELPLPLARLAECPLCRTDLHVCKMCKFFDPGVSKSCREPVADEVKEKERSNFCGYFQVKSGAFHSKENSETAANRAQLQALFDIKSNHKNSDAAPTDEATHSEADAAKKQLEDLFGLKNDGNK